MSILYNLTFLIRKAIVSIKIMSKLVENYLSINKNSGPVDFKEKGSRFISFAFPVMSVKNCTEIISTLRKKYYDCTHVCSSYIIGKGTEELFRYNDDGEPSGTAGLPIYNEIKGAKLFNILITVIRYYGGTKLGTGGLTRAYGNSAKLIIKNTTPVMIYIKEPFQIRFPYNFTGEIMHVFEKNEIEICKQEYLQDEVIFMIDIPIGRVKMIDEILINKSGGKVNLLKC